MFLKSVRTKLSNGNCALLYSHQQLLWDQQQDILIVSNVSLVPIFICRKVIYLQRRWVFSCVAKSQLSLDISVANFKIIIRTGNFGYHTDIPVQCCEFRQSVQNIKSYNKSRCPSDDPLYLWNYWTDLNETLHVGWDWLPSGSEMFSNWYLAPLAC